VRAWLPEQALPRYRSTNVLLAAGPDEPKRRSSASGRCGACWATARFGPALGLTGPSDVAALPLFALGAEAVAAASAPIGYALSRYQERRADRFAIRLTDDPASLVSGLRRLGAQNLAEEAPSRLVELLWHTHPPLGRPLAAKRDAENSHRSDAVRTASP